MASGLDTLDRSIIRQLQADGRKSNVDIARDAGVAEATIRKRLERLLTEQVIRICALPDPARVDMPLLALVMLQVDLQQADETAERLRAMPEVRSLVRVTGEYDLVAEVLFPSQEHLLRFLSGSLAALPGVHRTSTSHVLQTLKPLSEWSLPEPRGPRVLVVDDDPDFCEITRVALESAGYDVASATSGREALTRARMQKPDVVIMDVMMESVLDGLGAAHELRADRLLHDVPVLMVTSIPISEQAAMFPTDESLPADAFLTKPVDPSRLVEEVRRVLRPR
jgi:Lrp/AsnC family transcriptional regulator, regulator for asnA, asnC and gidA